MDFIKNFIKSETYCNKLSNKLNLALGNKQNLFTFCPFIFQPSMSDCDGWSEKSFHTKIWVLSKLLTAGVIPN